MLPLIRRGVPGFQQLGQINKNMFEDSELNMVYSVVDLISGQHLEQVISILEVSAQHD